MKIDWMDHSKLIIQHSGATGWPSALASQESINLNIIQNSSFIIPFHTDASIAPNLGQRAFRSWDGIIRYCFNSFTNQKLKPDNEDSFGGL
jgi:hypothetical protein